MAPRRERPSSRTSSSAPDGTESRRAQTNSNPKIEPNPELRRAPPNSPRGLRNRRSQVRILSGALTKAPLRRGFLSRGCGRSASNGRVGNREGNTWPWRRNPGTSVEGLNSPLEVTGTSVPRKQPVSPLLEVQLMIGLGTEKVAGSNPVAPTTRDVSVAAGRRRLVVGGGAGAGSPSSPRLPPRPPA
jgi:hypothetical protein